MPTPEGWLHDFGVFLGWCTIFAMTFLVNPKAVRAEEREQRIHNPSNASNLLKKRYDEAVRDLYDQDDENSEGSDLTPHEHERKAR